MPLRIVCTMKPHIRVTVADRAQTATNDMFPIRCYTCNTVIAHKYGNFSSQCRNGKGGGAVLDELGVTRMCCRRMFISYVESLSTQQLAYPNTNIVLDKGGTTMYRLCERVNVVSCD